MSDAGKSQEPSMEEILASIRRIIAEDEAGRARAAAAPLAPRSTDSPSRGLRSTDTPSRGLRRRNGAAEAPPARPPQSGASEDMVLDLTNMVAADGSVVTIAPTFPQNGRAAPPPQHYAHAPMEQQASSFSGFARRAPPPPGPGTEPRAHSFTPPQMPPAAPMGFPAPDSPSRGVRPQESSMAPIPPSLSEDSPSRRVFKRRHTAGSAFAELAQSGFAPQPQEANGNFGKVPAGSVATELDMGAAPPLPHASAAGPAYSPPDRFANAGYGAPPPPLAPPALSEDQIRAAVSAAAEPIIRSWLDANLHRMVELQMSELAQRVEQSISASLPQVVDQRIHQNVESNLGPYIEDRVGAHVDARLAAAVEEKVTAAVRHQVAAAVNQQIAQAVSQHVTTAVNQQIQGQQGSVTRLVDERVKSEIRGLFQRLAGN